MDVDPHLARLLADLARPDAWPVPTSRVEVVQTHASAVFLGDHDVLKVKKPVDLGFLDYGSLGARRRCCDAEVALNRRLAPDVYLGVLPITQGLDGRLRVGGDAFPVEWAVHMRRLPEERTLRALVLARAVPPGAVERVAQVLAAFHRSAERPPEARRYATFEAVATLMRDNLDVLRAHPDDVDPAEVARLADATERALADARGLVDARAARAAALHGDLRAEHVVLLDDRVLVIDAIEFADAYRHGDPASDVAFLVMDLAAYGAWAEADALAATWLRETGDAEAAALLPLYVAYRSAVRAKVALFQLDEPELAASHDAARGRARRHVRLALGALLPASERPRLLVTAGLPGSGKSTLARGLAGPLGAEVVRTDVVRKALAGLPPDARGDAALYTDEVTARTYARCRALAADVLAAGRPVIVDGNFRTAAQREAFRALALELGVPFHVLRCEADDAVLIARLRGRRGDASDADEGVLARVRASWEPPAGDEVIEVDVAADGVGRVLGVLGVDGVPA